MSRISVELTPESKRVIEAHAKRPAMVFRSLQDALSQGLNEAATHVMVNKLSAPFRFGEKRGGSTPVATRTGALRASITAKRDEPLSGFVGSTQGPASSYARTILGDEDVTITPVNAKHLWIPLSDNLTKAGRVRLTPRAAMDLKGPKGGRRLRIFTSKAGNLIAGMKGPVPGVRRKGFIPLFVLKDEVTIKGTNALYEGVEEKHDRIRDLLEEAIVGAMEGKS